jgi:hypothetical protein
MAKVHNGDWRRKGNIREKLSNPARDDSAYFEGNSQVK